MSISVENVSKSFGTFQALDGVSLEVRSGELIALLGPSGSGKTTLLRIIAGLEIADSGSVRLSGKEALRGVVQRREIGFVFQHYALFKHMTVFENVAFGLRVRKDRRFPKKEIASRVLKLLGLVHLEGFHDRYPAQLSGGQRQRVALARALAVEPKVLLLDEPFGALDAKVRQELRRWIRRLHEDIQITSVFVTHDQEEAMEVADRVVVMRGGTIEQVGTPTELWTAPANGFVYDFLGNYNQFKGWRDSNGRVHLADFDVGPAGAANDSPSAHGCPVTIYARPHEMHVARSASGDNRYLAARVVHINPAGSLIKLELERRDGALIQADVPASVIESQGLIRGASVFVRPLQTRVFE